MPKDPAKRGRQKGAVRHAEGEHGIRTHNRIIEQLESGRERSPSEEDLAAGEALHRSEGKHRLFEGRRQHDLASKHSEKTRLSRDIDRHGHNRENDEVWGGTDTQPAMPRRTKPPRLPER